MNDKLKKDLSGLVKVSSGNSALGKLKSTAIQQKSRSRSGTSESLVIALDVSGSMGFGDKMEAAKMAAANLVWLSDFNVSHIGVVGFSDGAKAVCWPGIPKSAVMEKVKEISTGGVTNMNLGMALAREMLSISRRDVLRIILMSDGNDTSGHALEEARKCAEQYIIIDTVGFGADCDKELLKAISDMTGGVFKEAKDADELIKQFKLLEFRTRGLLGTGK